MTPNEYQILLSPRLSHAARSLYTCIYTARHRHITLCVSCIQNAHLWFLWMAYLQMRQRSTAVSKSYFSRLVNCAHMHQQEHYHEQQVTLPHSDFKQTAQSNLPYRQMLCVQIGANAQFTQLCRLCSFDARRFLGRGTGEFIAYWLGRPEIMQSQHHWMLKFIKVLKNKRLAKPVQRPVTVGYQSFHQHMPGHPPKSTISPRAREMMEQAKAYIAEQPHDKK